MRLIAFAALMLIGGFGQAEAQPAQVEAPGAPERATGETKNFMLTSRIDHQDVMRVYPRDALRRRVAGFALVRCEVMAQGDMADCAIEQEAPAGSGFGQAALRLMPRFKMKSRNGASLEGGVVQIPIQFRPPSY